jgi:hypothetical protein
VQNSEIQHLKQELERARTVTQSVCRTLSNVLWLLRFLRVVGAWMRAGSHKFGIQPRSAEGAAEDL